MGFFAPSAKAIGLQVPDGDQNVISIPPFPGGRPGTDAIYPDASYERYARDGYGRNELVYACISEKAQSLPQSTLRVYPDQAGGEAIDDHPLRRLLAQPNPVCSEYEFFELSVTYLDLAGGVPWLIERARSGQPAALWPLRPDLLRVFPTSNPRIYDYGYVPDPSRPRDIVLIGRRDLIHVKYPNPLDPYFGQPPLRPAARATSLDNAATDFVDSLLRNDAIPQVVVETQQAIDQQVADTLRAKWRMRRQRKEPAFLQAGMTIKPIGLDLRALEFPDLRTISESRICMALGVPPILIGAKVGLDRSTFTNYGEARVSFWEETIMPLQRRFGDPVRQRLLAEFSGVGRRRVVVRWDNSDVLALRESEQARWDRATQALRAGGVTVNDFRRTVGLPEVTGGETFLIPAGVTTSPVGEAPAVPPPTADQEPTQPAQPAPLRAASAGYAERFLAGFDADQAGRRLDRELAAITGRVG